MGKTASGWVREFKTGRFTLQEFVRDLLTELKKEQDFAKAKHKYKTIAAAINRDFLGFLVPELPAKIKSGKQLPTADVQEVH